MQQVGNQRVGNRTRDVWGWRERALVGARARFNAGLPREGRILRQCRRCLVAHNNLATSRDLREWCWPAQPVQHWFYWSITRAMKRLGAKQIGRAGGVGRPAIWTIV